MKLYVDDIRPAPEGWQQARTVTDAIKFLSNFGNQVTEISLDESNLKLPVLGALGALSPDETEDFEDEDFPCWEADFV